VVRKLVTAVVILALVGLAIGIPISLVSNQKYQVTAVLPRADPNLYNGNPVYIDGFKEGSIDSIDAKNNKAMVKITINRKYAPLHSGAKAGIQWKALIGERLLYVKDGPAGNPSVPDGGMIAGKNPTEEEVGDVLTALNPKTRKHLSSLTHQLKGTLNGHENDLNETLQTAGPALKQVGSVLRQVGTDGPAIRALVTQVNKMVAKVDSKSGDLRGAVDNLHTSMHTTAQQESELSSAIRKLPGTLDTAKSTLGDVPDVTDKTLPLLHDLKPATARLRTVSKNLKPLLVNLRPTIAQLKPTLRSADTLLNYTPDLLDSAHQTVPEANTALHKYNPVLSYLRPYTPEALGFLSTWASAGQGYDSNGHYERIFGAASLASLDDNPGVVPPGITQTMTREPGAAGKYARKTGADGQGMH
jgi:phospholipid/cholesterol/gamma-HCH transport system substrate-binding protein